MCWKQQIYGCRLPRRLGESADAQGWFGFSSTIKTAALWLFQTCLMKERNGGKPLLLSYFPDNKGDDLLVTMCDMIHSAIRGTELFLHDIWRLQSPETGQLLLLSNFVWTIVFKKSSFPLQVIRLQPPTSPLDVTTSYTLDPSMLWNANCSLYIYHMCTFNWNLHILARALCLTLTAHSERNKGSAVKGQR